METQTRTGGADAATLGLGSVLVGSLPAALMTDDAPERYTVETVFTRRPQKDEVAAILDGETRDFLTRAGYPTVEVAVSDRRLEIANTNLEELRDGLAAVLMDRLAEISERVRAVRDAAEVRMKDAADHEHTRAAAVVALAESVHFRASGPADADAAQLSEWDGEGGHERMPRS